MKLTPNIKCQSNPEGILNGVTRVHYQQRSVLFVSQGIKRMILLWLLLKQKKFLQIILHLVLMKRNVTLEHIHPGTHTWVRNLTTAVFFLDVQKNNGELQCNQTRSVKGHIFLIGNSLSVVY